MRGHPLIRGHFLRAVSHLFHVKEPVGYLSYRDTFSWILRCPLKTGITVLPLGLSSSLSEESSSVPDEEIVSGSAPVINQHNINRYVHN